MKTLCGLFVLFYACAALTREVECTPRNCINLVEKVSAITMLKLLGDLEKLDKLRGFQSFPIYIVINSPGGLVNPGLIFAKIARTYANIQTITLEAGSMAAFLVQMLPGRRLMVPEGTFMFHHMRTLCGEYNNTVELSAIKKELEAYEAPIIKTISLRLKMSEKAYRMKIVDDWKEVGASALKHNMADEIVSLKCSQELIDLNKCPLK